MIRSGTPTFVQGFLYGCLLSFSQISFGFLVILAVAQLSVTGYVTTILAMFSLGIMLIATSFVIFIFVGMKASERTGKVATGRNVGAWTGLCNSIIYSSGFFIFFNSQVDGLRARAQNMVDSVGMNFHYTNLYISIFLFNVCIITILLTVLSGFGFGALGGTIGKKRAHLSGQP